jgi:peptidoglycan/LPS O-acetylase OafA/YrhL
VTVPAALRAGGREGEAGPTTAPAFELGHRPALDGLRGVAIMLVLLFHLGLLRGGWIGVDLFFVLSGFLITSLLEAEWRRTGRIDLRAFYRRRILRLIPALVAVLVVFTAAQAIRGPAARTGRVAASAASALLYFTNWRLALGFWPDNTFLHTWSLSIEEQFYVLWPLAFLLLLRLTKRRDLIVALLACGIAAVVCFRAIHWVLWQNEDRLFFGLDARSDGLLAGCLLALLLAGRRIPPWAGLAGVLAAAAVALVAWRPFGWAGRNEGGLLVVNLAAALVLLSLLAPSGRSLAALLECRPLVWIGKISYGLYLWHWPLNSLLQDARVPLSPAGLVLRIAAAFLLASGSYYLLERPFLRLRRRSVPGAGAERFNG